MDQWQLSDLEGAPANTVIVSLEQGVQCVYEKHENGYWLTMGTGGGFSSEDVFDYTDGVYAILERPKELL